MVPFLFCVLLWCAAMMRDVLLPLLEPVVESEGFELVDVEFARAGRGSLLRIYIDLCGLAAGDDDRGVSVDDCARVSQAVSRALEGQDPIAGQYTLEVSSPGSDRILRKREHFERFAGERAAIELKLAIDGRRRFTGRILGITPQALRLEVDGREHELPLEWIQKARLKP